MKWLSIHEYTTKGSGLALTSRLAGNSTLNHPILLIWFLTTEYWNTCGHFRAVRLNWKENLAWRLFLDQLSGPHYFHFCLAAQLLTLNYFGLEWQLLQQRPCYYVFVQSLFIPVFRISVMNMATFNCISHLCQKKKAFFKE